MTSYFICGAKRTRNRGICQKRVKHEGTRCAEHSELGHLTRKQAQQATQKLKEAQAQEEALIQDIDASSVQELANKLEPELEVVAQLERTLRDPGEQQGEDVYVAISARNIIRMQLAAEANPQNRALMIAVGNMIGQHKLTQSRFLANERTRLELTRLHRQIDALQTDKTDVLSYMTSINRMLADGFITTDPSPRTSLENYLRWLGETTTVEDVLAGQAETANAPWAMQREILQALFWPETLGKPNLQYTICVTGNGMGKSYVSARAILFHALFCHPSITIVTGPRLSQVRDTISAEVRRIHSAMSLPGKANVLRWQPDPQNDRAYVNYTSAQSDDAFAGHHGRILIIMEEASGIPAHIFESTHGLMSGGECRMLQIGNMHRRQGKFYEWYDRAQKAPDDPSLHLIQKSAFDHPNYLHRTFIQQRGGQDIYPHAVNAQWVDQSIADWGSDSHRAATRIHGQPPRQDTNAMISLHLVEEAVGYTYLEDPDADDLFEPRYEVIAADIAGLGDNLTVIVSWQWGDKGHQVAIKRVMSLSDHSDVADALIDAASRPLNDDLYFSCDTNGEGSGILEMLIERGVDEWLTRGFKSHDGPEDPPRHDQAERYSDLEAESWARLRTWLRRSMYSINQEERGDLSCRIAFPDEQAKYSSQLVRELTERDHSLDAGKIRLQPKREYIEQLGHSPDFAEAVVIASRMVHYVQTEFLGQTPQD